MLIDFSKIPTQTIPSFKGGLKEISCEPFADEDNRVMQIHLKPGASVGMHKHEGTSEIVYVLEGSAVATCDGVDELLTPGCCHYCADGHTHGMINRGAADFRALAVIGRHG